MPSIYYSYLRVSNASLRRITFQFIGRMHQIRVHLQHLGYPIANDPIYNLNVDDAGSSTGTCVCVCVFLELTCCACVYREPC